MTNLEKTTELITKEQLSKEQQKAAKLVLEKHKNLFIQGQAGTGKSAFITYLRGNSNKNIVLCSPTAITALNIGGTTLHSLFRLPIMDFITEMLSAMSQIISACEKNTEWSNCYKCPFMDQCDVLQDAGLGTPEEWDTWEL